MVYEILISGRKSSRQPLPGSVCSLPYIRCNCSCRITSLPSTQFGYKSPLPNNIIRIIKLSIAGAIRAPLGEEGAIAIKFLDAIEITVYCIDVAGGINSHTSRQGELGCAAGAVREAIGPAGERRDGAVGRRCADGVVVGIGNVENARRINGNVLGKIEERRCGRSAVAVIRSAGVRCRVAVGCESSSLKRKKPGGLTPSRLIASGKILRASNPSHPATPSLRDDIAPQIRACQALIVAVGH